MPLRRRTGKRPEGDPRRRIFLWAVLFSLLAGLTNLGMPIDAMLKIARNKIRAHDASGQIVMVGIDDRTLAISNSWPWPRRHFADLNDRISDAAPKGIYYDFDFSSGTNQDDDGRLAASFSRSKAPVILATQMRSDPRTSVQSYNLPLPAFRSGSSLAHINIWYDSLGYSWRLPFDKMIDGHSVPSMSSRMADRKGVREDDYPIDFALRIGSVPYVSGADILAGKVDPARLSGRRIIVAPVSDRFEDIKRIPGQGYAAGAYFHVLGAETLMAGTPRDLHWSVFLALAAIAAAGAAFLRRALARAGAAAAGFALVLGGPVLLEMQLVFTEVAPALLLITIATIGLAISAMRKRSASHNLISGLPNLNALKAAKVTTGAPLVAAKIKNFGEITSALPGELERTVVEQIVARLKLGAEGGQVYQGDDGIFAWFLEEQESGPIADHIDALHAMFRAPISVGGRSVDAVIAFGVDQSTERSVTNRLGSALVGAEEAAAEGLRWKGYDRERLKDAEWKLSLLGRLDVAIDHGEVWVAFQPKLDLTTGIVTGAEALARWTHPEKGEISPADFVLLAEQNNRIERLTEFVMEKSVIAARTLVEAGHEFTVAVNLSARLLDDPKTFSRIRDILRKQGLPPTRLTIEVTESASMTGDSMAFTTLEQIRNLGVGLSIDDYGTGYSTLDYLKKVPATEIKIDRSFVSLITTSPSDRLMVSSTIELAHSLGRKIVAEGVEDLETLSALKRMGCDLVQGYYVSRPVAFDSLVALVNAPPRTIAA